MSTTLILNAGSASPVNLVVQQAGENAPVEVGTVTPSFNGADRSSVRAVKRTFGSLTTYVDTATKDSIINLLKWGRQVPCSGDLLGNLQTLCTMRYTGSRMVPGLGGLFWEVGLTGNEVQPTNTLLRYSVADVLTSEAFTRSTTATYVDINGVVQTAAINVKRDGHYLAGAYSLLLENARTNVALWNRDLTNAAWTKVNMTTAHTSLGADGVAASATRLTATAGNATALQSVTLGSSARFQSAYVKRITGVGAIQMTTDGGATWTTITTTAAYLRLSIPTQTLANPNFGFRIVTSGDAIDVDFVQNENGAFASSAIPTTTTAVTRAADNYSLPYTAPPGETTVYARFVESGSLQTSSAGIFALGGASAPVFACYSTGSVYRASHSNGASTVVSDLGVGPVVPNVVELALRSYADGSVDITQSINGAASTTSAQTTVNALANAWSAQLCWLNSLGAGNYGFMGLQALRIVSGIRSLSEMRNS